MAPRTNSSCFLVSNVNFVLLYEGVFHDSVRVRHTGGIESHSYTRSEYRVEIHLLTPSLLTCTLTEGVTVRLHSCKKRLTEKGTNIYERGTYSLNVNQYTSWLKEFTRYLSQNVRTTEGDIIFLRSLKRLMYRVQEFMSTQMVVLI